MCVILIKPRGVKMPSYSVLNAMRIVNRDGFGYVSERSHYKGMDFATFLERLGRVSDDENCIIHFRWATHGSKKKANCHPFFKDGVWFAHNGILNITPIGDMTDSETAFRSQMLPYIKRYGINSEASKAVINSVIGGSRFAFMVNGEVYMFGQYTKMYGCYFSNLNFMGWYRDIYERPAGCV